MTLCSPWIHVAESTAEAQAIKRTIDEEDAKHMAGGRNIVADMHDGLLKAAVRDPQERKLTMADIVATLES